MRKQWVDMDREELLDEKALWESKLQKLNLELGVLRRKGAVGRQYTDSATYEGMLKERLRLAAGLRGVSSQLSKVNAARRATSTDVQLDNAFRKVAKLILEPDLYEEILAGATDMVKGREP